MIVTVTPNPGLDLTYTLPAETGGPGAVEVHRSTSATLEASGKGVNVSRALARAGVATLAVLPVAGGTGRHLAELLEADGVPHRVVPQAGETRVNTSALRPGADTLKINGPGAALSADESTALLTATHEALRQACSTPEAAAGTWLAVCGSLPPGAAPSLVADLVALAHHHGARCAVDASGPALATAMSAGADLLAPNRAELEEVLAEVRPGADLGGGVEAVATAARAVCRRTGGAMLVSLGADGALHVDARGARHARGPALVPVNTAGAGDALLAGWLSLPGTHPEGERLARAVRWGRSACLSPTTVDPDPGRQGGDDVTVVEVPLPADTTTPGDPRSTTRSPAHPRGPS